MDTDYVFLCGAMWSQYESVDAGWELVRALHSDDPEVVSLACAILEQTIGSPAITNLVALERPMASWLG
jgi:hypothetical protein